MGFSAGLNNSQAVPIKTIILVQILKITILVKPKKTPLVKKLI
jgi:hypothetical protein